MSLQRGLDSPKMASSSTLVHKMSPFFDPHMMFPIISWLESASASPDSPVNFRAADLLDAKLSLVTRTAMPDYELELWCEKVSHSSRSLRARRARESACASNRCGRMSPPLPPLPLRPSSHFSSPPLLSPPGRRAPTTSFSTLLSERRHHNGRRRRHWCAAE